MDCKHRAGLTYRVSRLKPRASEKMGDLITNNEDLFFSSPILLVANRTSEDVHTVFLLFTMPILFSENGIFEDVKTFFSSSNQCDQIAYRASHCLNPALSSVLGGPLCHTSPPF